MTIRSQKDLLAGLMFSATGIAFALGARQYELGTASRMGPGYFPFVLGVLLTILGAMLAFRAFGPTIKKSERIGPVAWRPLCCIIAANLLFGVLLGGLPSWGLPSMGLLAAIVGLTFMAMLAGQHFSFKSAVQLSLLLATGSYVVFVHLLHLSIPVWPAGLGY